MRDLKTHPTDDTRFISDEFERMVIPAHLRSIEQENDVKILLAVEAGSRAWGFESANSDWDVRFIYVHKPEWYFRVDEQRDVIEAMYDDDVDLAGWELRKVLRLFMKSNPSLLEWLNSPIVYCENTEFVSRIREVEKDYFNPIKAMYHYNRIYIKHDERYLQKQGFPMKRFLYYLRGVLACKWIESRLSLPPVPFNELVDATVDDSEIRLKIDELIKMKKSGKEHDMVTVENHLVNYARHWADYYSEAISSFRPALTGGSAEALDAILFDMVKANT